MTVLVYVQVEIKTKPDTPDIGNLQKAADFVHAYILGAAIPSAMHSKHPRSCVVSIEQ